MKTKTLISATTILLLLATFSSYAALLTRLGGQAFYDTELNITWLASANLARSTTLTTENPNHFGVTGISGNGSMSWTVANQWISAMNTSTYLGFSDWRMPVLKPVSGLSNFNFFDSSYNGTTDIGYNLDLSSEMAHLYYSELGNFGAVNEFGVSNSNSGLINTGDFIDMQSSSYWSGLTYEASSNNAWYFDFSTGYQGATYDGIQNFVLVVRNGDISTVPVPAAFWLFSSGLLGLFGYAGRKPQS